MRSSRGFTLLELLIVISLVGILAVVLIIVLNPLTQFKKARDSQRRTAIKELQNSLEQYYNDNGSYPTTGGSFWSSEPNNDPEVDSSHTADWIPGLSPTYISTLPKDPLGGNSTFPYAGCATYKKAYLYRSDGAEYALFAYCSIESISTVDPQDSFYDPAGKWWVWKVCSGQTACSSW